VEACVRREGQILVAIRSPGDAVHDRDGNARQPDGRVAVIHVPAEVAGIVVVPAPGRVWRLGVVWDAVGVGMKGSARHVHPDRPEVEGREDRDGQGVGDHQQQAHASRPAVGRYADHAPRGCRVRTLQGPPPRTDPGSPGKVPAVRKTP
jgi:hypothetical protein